MPHDLSEFAASRGFQPSELEEYGVRVEEDEVVIPIRAGHHVWYERTHRPGGKPKYLSPKGAETHLYNPLGLGPHSEEVWIAEGEFDTLALIAAGAPALGILGVGNFYTPWAHLFSGARIIVAFDPDKAGEEAADKIAGLFPQGVERFEVPPPYGDINDWLKADRRGLTKAVLEF